LILVEIPTTVKNKELVERRRKQIVLAGIKLFSRNGFHKTTLKRFGPIDVYVHDLGIGATAPAPAGRAAGVAEQLGASFQKVRALTRSLGKRMKERRKGRIVFETVTAGVCALCTGQILNVSGGF
jgi:NAD(P)-dependent dehydrogenase (short-subunit alcohol dehydrogenase family)